MQMPNYYLNDTKKTRKINKRIHIFYFLAIAISITLLFKIIYIQIIEASKLGEICRSKSQIKLIERAPRGDIFDHNNNIIATTIINKVLYIDKSKITNKEKLINEIVSVGILSYEEVKRRLKSKLNYVPIVYDLSEKQIKKLHSYNEKAIIIKKEQLRHYVHPEVFSGLIGFIGVDNKGLEGLEYKYNDVLSGEDGYTVYEKKPTGRLYEHPSNDKKEPIKGKDIKLTIDSDIQEIAYYELKKYVDKLHANYGSVIIMETKTGKILAMANYPSYNNNLYATGDVSKCKNYAIHSLYEPGSIFKLITAAAALEYNIIDENDIVKSENEDTLIINNHIITDAHKLGKLTFKDAFVHSSNVGFVNIGNKVGKRLLYVMINAMGFNRKTNIGLPGEEKGFLMHEKDWIPIHQANICFGQGISVNALQMICAYNIVANNGVYISPSIIEKIDKKNVLNSEKKRVLKKETTIKLNEMLVDVVKYGTGKKANVKGIQIAGKTGTAEKSKEGKGYVKGKFTSSFVGYFPANNPEIIMIVTLDEPYIYWGSEAAAPLFSNITLRILNLNKYKYLINKKTEIQS